MEYYSYYGIEKYTFCKKWFWSRFFTCKVFCKGHFQSCLSHKPLRTSACVIWLVIGSSIHLNGALLLQKHIEWEGWTLHNSGHGEALCHVFDMSFLGKVQQQVTEETPNLKYHRYIYQDDNHSLMMHECILVDNCVCSFNIKATLFMYPID